MPIHTLPQTDQCLHGVFDNSLTPALTVDSGDEVEFDALDAGWGRVGRELGVAVPAIAKPEGAGHALCGPIAVRNAEPGDVLAVELLDLVPGSWGYTWAGPRPWLPQFNFQAGAEVQLHWTIDVASGTATDRNGLGISVPLRPFLGVMGNAPAEPGSHETAPPRRVGGNIDCRELVVGSTLFLPVAVPGALFSAGDGHAQQGDGEISQTAIECPMRARLRLTVRKDLHFTAPRAVSAAGYITFGFGDTLDEATAGAVDGMLDHLQSTLRVTREEALALSSVAVNLHVTQIVNGRVGIHAILPPDMIRAEQ